MTVFNSAVKPDSGAPVTFVEYISAIVPAPPRRGPKDTDRRRSDPGRWNQVIIAAAPAPVTGRPDVALDRTRRVLVHLQNRRSKIHAYCYMCVRVQHMGPVVESQLRVCVGGWHVGDVVAQVMLG